MFTKLTSSLFVSAALLAAALSATACGSKSPPVTTAPIAKPAIDFTAAATAIVTATDRDATDITMDAGRHPAEFLAFLQLPPGARVGEISSGTGYTTELLARAVGPTGAVYGQNNAFVIEKFAAAGWATRLAKPVNQNVVRVDRELDAPMPPDVTGLDAIVNVLFYHDTVWMKTDRAAMNKAIFAALRSGGTYTIVDHAAATGHGIADVSTLHRIEESLVRSEIEAAGFRFAEAGTFLRNSNDAHDWNASPSAAADKRGTSDRFVLKFVKP